VRFEFTTLLIASTFALPLMSFSALLFTHTRGYEEAREANLLLSELVLMVRIYERFYLLPERKLERCDD
jgi:hypothetical protein